MDKKGEKVRIEKAVLVMKWIVISPGPVEFRGYSSDTGTSARKDLRVSGELPCILTQFRTYELNRSLDPDLRTEKLYLVYRFISPKKKILSLQTGMSNIFTSLSLFDPPTAWTIGGVEAMGMGLMCRITFGSSLRRRVRTQPAIQLSHTTYLVYLIASTRGQCIESFEPRPESDLR